MKTMLGLLLIGVVWVLLSVIFFIIARDIPVLKDLRADDWSGSLLLWGWFGVGVGAEVVFLVVRSRVPDHDRCKR